ncbi:MAG: hypothetical protein LUQ04_03310 [Methanoregula sp.]|nr:hypothetical protein [Methanoregula sp.]
MRLIILPDMVRVRIPSSPEMIIRFPDDGTVVKRMLISDHFCAGFMPDPAKRNTHHSLFRK